MDTLTDSNYKNILLLVVSDLDDKMCKWVLDLIEIGAEIDDDWIDKDASAGYDHLVAIALEDNNEVNVQHYLSERDGYTKALQMIKSLLQPPQEQQK